MQARKLSLKKETLRSLTGEELSRAGGAVVIVPISGDWPFQCGITQTCGSCFCTWDCHLMTRGTNCCDLSMNC